MAPAAETELLRELQTRADRLGWGRRGPRPSGVIARYWAKVDRRGPDECWPWTGATNPKGYGLFGPGRRLGIGNQAHQFAFFLAHGRPPEPCGLHSCDNPPCQNPGHLFEGTVADNNADMVAKGRHYRFTPEDLDKSHATRGVGRHAGANR